METTQLGLLELPRRQYNINYNFPKSATKQCISNYYPIDLGPKTTIYQMSFETQPEIPNDSKDLLFQCIRSVKKEVRPAVQLIAISGRMLWGLKELKIPLNIKSQFLFEQKTFKFEVLIKVVKNLDISELLKTNDGQNVAFQVYNNQIKQILREKQMQQLLRGKYFDKKEVNVHEAGLNVLRGFKFTLCKLKSGLHLQIDVCSRVYRAANLLEELSKKSKDYAKELEGSSVLTNYGRRRTYRIIKINYDMNPFSKFFHDKRAGQVTFVQYYEESYGLKISTKNQPLVEVVLRTQKSFDKVKNQFIKKDIIGFLIPEFISLTGMSDEQRANFKTMQQIAPFTKLSPSERVNQTTQLVQTINRNGRLRVGQARRIVSFQLMQPYARLAGNFILKNHGDGNMNVRDKLRITVPFKDYVIVYSTGQNPKYDDNDADALVHNLNKASEAFGVKFGEPGFLACKNGSLQGWKNEIQKDISNNGKPQIIILYFNPPEQRYYGQLKRYITCDLKIPCQAVRRRTILKAKNPLSTASKIIVQMNQKIGGTAWQIIQQEGAYTSKKKTMYGSFAISKGKKGFTLAFVGTLDTNFTKVFCYCKTGFKSKDNIPEADYETMFLYWAKNYVSVNKQGPQLIIVYREGLSEQQTKNQVGAQIQGLKKVIKKIGEKTKMPNYNAEILYTTVTTKINSRFFDFPQGSSGGNGSNKFQPRVENPNSGTVVMDELTVNENFDFFLAAQRVTEGTCTPTHYQIVQNSSKISIEDFSQFTYEQCFNYYNWTGAVKVPATMQCANKLAKLVGESIQSNVTQGEVLTSYFFL